MKTLKTLALTTLFGLFSATTFAEEVAQTTAQPSTTQVAQPVVQPATMQPQATTVNMNQVNINTATAAEIQDKLIGIGAKKAQAIVDYRTKNGAFLSVEQLKEVSGIGSATLDKNRDRIILQ